jgi:hypothetical protein
MINESFANKIEQYVKQKENKGNATASTRGLLSPKGQQSKMLKRTQPQNKDPIETIGEYVYALRQQRNKLKNSGGKNGSK